MPVETPRIGLIVPQSRRSRLLQFVEDSGGDTYLWRDPIPGHEYVIGVDTAEGLIPEGTKKPDGTVVQVLDRTRGGEQVAKIYGQISEENLVEPLLLLAEFYHGAYVVIESNAGRHVCVEMKKNYEKHRLYHNDDWNEDKKRYSREVGHKMHVGNRRLVIGKMASKIEKRALILHDKESVHECHGFHTSAGGKAEAASGYHDDHVTALGMACIGLDSYPDNLKPFTPYSRVTSIPRSYRFIGGGQRKPIY